MLRTFLAVIATAFLSIPTAPAQAAEPAGVAPVPKSDASGKLSSRLAALRTSRIAGLSHAEQAKALSLPAKGSGSLIRRNGGILTEIRVGSTRPSVLADIRSAGAKITNVSSKYAMVTAEIPVADLKAVTAVDSVKSVTETLAPEVSGPGAALASNLATTSTTCPGLTTSEGDAQLAAADARSAFGVDGSGVEVGVLSDSFNYRGGANADVTSGDLPGPGNPCGRTTPVSVVQDSTSNNPEDEGRAMAQIVHDLAPGASLEFATGFSGEMAMADNIRALQSAGAKVIVDDVTYFDEPFFQDGPISNAVNDVTAAGVTYFSSAGNNAVSLGGNQIASWMAPHFRESAACPVSLQGPCMDFDPSSGDDNDFDFTLAPGSGTRIDLQWAEPWGGVTDDFDLEVYDQANNRVAWSEYGNPGSSGTQEPFEFTSLYNSTSSAQTYRIVINRYAGTGTPALKFVFNNNGATPFTQMEYPTSAGGDVVGPAIFGHNGAANTMSVAAIKYDSTTDPEPYSSTGPVGPLLFQPVPSTTALASPQTLAKPDITATDGVQNTFFGESSTGVWRFYGTSAAAPHAAAVAALELSALPTATVADIKRVQKATATPLGGFGTSVVGAGLLDANAAIARLLVPPCLGMAPTIVGTDSSETINGTPGPDVIYGAGGNDVINGLGGNDVICGGAGNDTINPGAGNDKVSGGAGTDTLSYSGAAGGVTFSLGSAAAQATGGSGSDTASDSFESVTGSSFADHLTGNSLANVIHGGAGNDILSGGGGNDALYGDSGNDTETGGAGADVFNGGTGVDTASYSTSSAGVKVTIDNTANDGNSSDGSTHDNVRTDVENVTGTKYADSLTGYATANALSGLAGADYLAGLGGNDRLTGGPGADKFYGGDGSDYLAAKDSTKDSVLSGGAGTDSGSFDAIDPARSSVP